MHIGEETASNFHASAFSISLPTTASGFGGALHS